MICFQEPAFVTGNPPAARADLPAGFLDALHGGDFGAWLPQLPDLALRELADAMVFSKETYAFSGLPKNVQAALRAPNESNLPVILSAADTCYLRAAQASAREMMLERDELRKLAGWRPLSSLEKKYLTWLDTGHSLRLFVNQDFNEQRGLLPPSKLSGLTLDDPQPYTPEEIDVASYLRAERIAERRRQLAALIGSGQAGIYSDAVTDLLDNPIALDPLYPVIGPENRDIAAEQDPTRRALLAMRQARDIDLQALAVETQKLENAGQVRRYWEGNYPTVELRAEDNPQIDPALLVRDWWSNAYPVEVLWSPPTVKVWVTPRTKPLPNMNWLGGIGGSILSTVLGFIPVIGTAASFAVSQAQKGIQNKFVSAALNGLPQSVFAPQYYPEPFFIALPLDEAQAAVKDPSFVPALAWRFRDQTGGLANPFQ